MLLAQRSAHQWQHRISNIAAANGALLATRYTAA